ncbi:MAG: CAP domain-containing protein [Solirubrobacteraceae bacterium]|jgi:uncharacterized protein YkwD
MPAQVQGEISRLWPHIGAALVAAALILALCALPLFANLAWAATTRPSPKHAPANTCPNANLRPSRTNAASIDAATLCLIDQARAARGLTTLKANRELQSVAVSQVDTMVRLDYFADDRPSGTTPEAMIAATRYGRHARSLSTAENIGWGTKRAATPAQMVAAWLQSPPHREVIFATEFHEAGVGATAAVPSLLAQGEPGATYALELARP